MEKEVIIPAAYPLSASLSLPDSSKDKLPAIIIIGGTGGGDRNGNQAFFPINTYGLLAEFLTQQDFVTLRYDKRGIKKSAGRFHETGLGDLVQDVLDAINYVKNLPQVDETRVLLLGHSEGCIIATLAQEKAKVAGLIHVSGAGICIKTAMENQLQALLDEVKQLKGVKGFLLGKLLSEKKAKAKQEKLFTRVMKSQEDVIRVGLQKFPAKWLREHLALGDQELVQKQLTVNCPALVLLGDKDVQVPIEGFHPFFTATNEHLTSHLIHNMDHMLRAYHGPKTILEVKKQYKKDIKLPLHDELKDVLKEWLTHYKKPSES